MELIAILFLPILHFGLEGFHDFYVWKASEATKYEHTQKWHQIDFVIKLVLYNAIAYIFFDNWQLYVLYLVFAGLMRIMWLNGTFNILRGDKLHYFSADSNWIDRLLGKTPELSYYGLSAIGIVVGITIYLIEQ